MARGASGETDPPNPGLLAGSPAVGREHTTLSSLSPACKTASKPAHQPAPGPGIRKRHVGSGVSSGVKALVSTMTLAAAVAGCSLPHVASMSSSKPVGKSSGPATATKTPQPSASPSAASTTVAATKASATLGVPGGDLSNGSLTRSLDAGSRKLVINYWTAQDPAQWTATRSTVISLAAHINNGDKDHAVLVSRFHVTLDDGSSVTTLADDKGAFTLTPPYAYSSGFVVRAPHANATSATVIVEYDLLIQIAPNMMAYFRQTVIDTLHINFAPNGQN